MWFRPEFLRFVEECGPSSLAFLTTNWDQLLEDELRCRRPGEEPRVGYLHGRIAEPDLALLPGEIVDEGYRSEEDRKRMALLSSWKYVHRARRLIIYGHSVFAVEAELRLTLAVGSAAPHPARSLSSTSRKEAGRVRKRLLPLLSPGREWSFEIRSVESQTCD